MSEQTSTAVTEAGSSNAGGGGPLGRIARGGGAGFWIRTGAVAIFDALLVFSLPSMVSNGSWTLIGLLAFAAALVNWAYLSPRTQAARWLTPGLVLMAIFVVYPVLYTMYVSVTNWSTGNVLSREQAIERIESTRTVATGQGETLAMAIYQDGDTIALLVGGGEREPFLGIPHPPGEEPEDPPGVDLPADVDPAAPPETIGDFELVPALNAVALRDRLQGAILDLPDGAQGRVATLSTLQVSDASQRFVIGDDGTLTDNQVGVTCEEGTGTFVCADVPRDQVNNAALGREDLAIVCDAGTCDGVPLFALPGSPPGWRTVTGFGNYTEILTNERIRAPFTRVLAWNIAFAALSVLMTFALGLFLAIALQKEDMRGRALYRSIYILPYAIPAFLSVFIWRGLLNTEFGKVNGLLEMFGLPAVDWLGSTVPAMAAVLIVNLWLGFPYMFLISSGALTGIPQELLEAARVDGASPWRSFRAITLPLLLISTAPLLIGAFAFNFNNFILIFLLTDGGPPLSGYDVPVGGTDLLISFTFDLAAGAGRGNQFGLASAIIVVIFIFLAIVSASSFRLTRRLEEIYE